MDLGIVCSIFVLFLGTERVNGGKIILGYVSRNYYAQPLGGALPVIVSFADKRTAAIFAGHLPRKGISPRLAAEALAKMQQMHAAAALFDLRLPPGNRLEVLKGDRRGQFSIRVDRQWRLCFRWQENDAHDVELVDYHD